MSEERPVVALYTTAESWRGAGISFVNIARGLIRHGFRPQLIATSPDVATEFIGEGMAVTGLPMERRMQGRRLRGVLIALGARVLIVDRAHDVRVAARAVLGTDIAVINRYNLFRAEVPDDLLTRLAYRDSVKEVVFLSDAARKRVLESAPFMRNTPVTTVHEGVDLDRFRPDPAASARFWARYRIAAPFLLAVGALAVEKRYEFMFDALGMLGTEAPQLVICGEGDQEEKLRARAGAMNLNVRFLGRLPHDHLPGAYNASIGLVHAGAVETFGLSVLEAMACGRPIVASAGGALPELMGADGACGTLVDVDSLEEMANAIRCLAVEPAEIEATGVRCRERALQFPISAMQDAYAALVRRHTRGLAS